MGLFKRHQVLNQPYVADAHFGQFGRHSEGGAFLWFVGSFAVSMYADQLPMRVAPFLLGFADC